MLVERAGAAAHFAWDEFFFAEHHNLHTQEAYMAAVKQFLSWVEERGVELQSITPKMVGQYLVGLGGSAAKRNLALAALNGFFDRLVNRHVVVLNPAASVKGVKEMVVEGKTPEIGVEHARACWHRSITPHVVGLRDRAILATLAYTACRAGARGRTVPGRARGAADNRALRPAEEAGHAEYRGADFDLAGGNRAMDYTVFYSGQYDLPKRHNRKFIHDAIEMAISRNRRRYVVGRCAPHRS